jgi:hypothetical protein
MTQEATAVAELKTKKTAESVTSFLDGLADPAQRKDSRQLVKLMKEATGKPPRMWGPAIVGFGDYHYKYETGREGDWFLTGFSPRKDSLSLYINSGFERYGPLLAKLGKHKTGKSCLYLKTLEDVDLGTLRELIQASVKHMAATQAKQKG